MYVDNIFLSQMWFQCRLCPETFDSQVNRFNHIQAIHDFHASFPCPVCVADFGTRVQFDIHLGTTHLNHFQSGFPTSCRMCSRMFQNQASLKHHVIADHAVIRSHFNCPLCPVFYIVDGEIDRHIKDVHGCCADCFNQVLPTGTCFMCTNPWPDCMQCPVNTSLRCRNAACLRPGLVDCQHCDDVFIGLVPLLEHYRLEHHTVPWRVECPKAFFGK